jgi:hypothetical protein
LDIGQWTLGFLLSAYCSPLTAHSSLPSSIADRARQQSELDFAVRSLYLDRKL